MLPEVTITSGTLMWGLAALTAAVLGIIWAFRSYVRARSTSDLKTKYAKKGSTSVLDTRRKYPEVNVLSWNGTFFRISLVIVMALAVLAFNWTTFEEEVFDDETLVLTDYDFEVTPPQTATPPPPPPPPPPPVIEEVDNSVILDDEDIEFEDMSVDEETIFDMPELIADHGEKDVPPPPPPPPPPEPEVEEIFKVVEDMPRFPGCEDIMGKQERMDCATKKLMTYLFENLEYPAVARENNVQGTVVIQFVVEKDGSIQGAKVVRDIGGGCGEAALKVVNDMDEKIGKWIPGKQRGRAVRVVFTLPVRFTLKA